MEILETYETMDEPLIRIMALHALVYCERLFYLEEVEEIRVADKAVYDGRRFHEQMPEYVELTSYTLESHDLGIKGKVDCIRTSDGRWIPFEYKKGHCRFEKKQVLPWPSDEIQVAAYAMLLEEHFGKNIPEARIYYAADHRTAIVSVDEVLRNKVRLAIDRAKELRKSPFRPPITDNERLCARCSLAPVCLPEEERLIEENSREVPRYFPPDRDLLDLHIIKPGTNVRRSSGSIVVEDREGTKKEFPSQGLGSITIHGPSQVTSQAISLCATRGIHIHWMTGGGRYLGSLAQSAGGTQRRLRQYAGLTNKELVLRLSRSLVKAKVEAQLRYILRLTRGKDRSQFVEHIAAIRDALKKVGADNIDRENLLGYEGIAAKAYFACLGLLINADNSKIRFDGRNRRPPKDPANALLSFLYSLLYRDCVQSIVTVGLDPTIGFYHQPRSSAYPLALDIMELFRVTLCDMILVGSLNRNQWELEEDFVQAGQQVWLSDEGKKKIISLYERRKQDEWKHPVIGYSLSYDRAIELEVRLLEKEWSGVEGLFALNRIR